MTSFVLTYEGPPEKRDAEEVRLRARFPTWSLYRKTPTVLEVSIDGWSALPTDNIGPWKATPMRYAEIAPPSINFGTLRKRMAELKNS